MGFMIILGMHGGQKQMGLGLRAQNLVECHGLRPIMEKGDRESILSYVKINNNIKIQKAHRFAYILLTKISFANHICLSLRVCKHSDQKDHFSP